MSDVDGSTFKCVCSYCNKTVTKSLVKCLTCAKTFHKSCADRVKAKPVGEVECICAQCGLDASDDPAPPSRLDLLLMLLASKDELIRDKQVIIDARDTIIRDLQSKLRLLSADNALSCQKCNKGKQRELGRKSAPGPAGAPSARRGAASGPSLDGVPVVGSYSSALGSIAAPVLGPFALCGAVPASSAPLQRDEDVRAGAPRDVESIGEGFTTVKSKRNRRRRSNAVVGTAADKSIRGVPKLAHVHVFKLAPATRVEDLQAFLGEAGFTDAVCTTLPSRYPDDYSSFKISLPFDQLPGIRNPGLWPSGVKLDRFFLGSGRRDRPG